jgi:hypothetical protein
VTDWAKEDYSTLHAIGKTYQCISWGGNRRGGGGPTLLIDSDGGLCGWWYNSKYMQFNDWVAESGCPPEKAVMLKLQYE